jgi:MYXO-CTERM domain-containing protein
VRLPIFLLAAALLSSPAQGFVQLNDTGEVDIGDAQRDVDGNSRLGLLGLLGLAGLLGLKRREPDIHVDARREK